jgi:hypothetical protein
MILYLPVKYQMKRIIFILLSFLSLNSAAQEVSQDPNQGTIRVTKKGILHSVIYDEVNFRLVCRDIYGNIIDTAVVSFDIHMTVKGIAYSEKTAGSFLSKPMQQRLSRLDGMTTLIFSNVKAKEKNGMIISFPDFKTRIGRQKEKFDD